MKYRKTLLSASVFAALCFAGAAVAQDAGADASNDTRQLGTIEVHGIRGSLVQSLATKRSANSIVDAVTAEDIGKFPATNVAEALTQIPGVTLDRAMPATQRVSINGLDPRLNLTLLDGHPVAQAIWLFGASPNRGFNFSLLPPEIVGKLEVYKSYQARLPAGGLGGTIVVHTRDPLDLAPNTVAGSVGYNYNAMSDDGKPNVSLFYSTHNLANTFGFNISVQHYEQPIDRQGKEVFGYHPVSDYAAQSPAVAAQVAAGELDPNALVPDEVNAAHFTQTEKRDSAYINFQFRPNDVFKTSVALMYWDDNLDSVNQSLYPFAHNYAGMVTALGDVRNGIVHSGSSRVPAGSPCQNDFTGACPGAGVTEDNFARGSEIKTKGIDWKLAYTGEDWGVSGQLGFNESNNDILQVLKELSYEGGYDWTLGNGFTFTDPATATNPEYWFDVWKGNYIERPYSAREQYAQVDFSKDINSVFNQILFGVRFERHWEDQSNFNYANLTAYNLRQIGFGGLTDLSGAADLGLGPDMVHHVKTSGFDAIVNAARSGGIADTPNATVYYQNTWKVKQTHTAAYVQANFSNSYNLRGNVGVRVVRTKTDSHSWQIAPGCLAFGCADWTPTSNTHTDALPAFNIAYTPVQDVVLRAAASETVAYNPYNELAAYFAGNDTVLTASAGNPNIDPYKSVNFSVSAEWYFSHASLLAVSIFNKNIINYVESKSNFETHANASWNTANFNRAPFLATGQCTAEGICRYSVTKPVNGGHGQVTGYTLNYQQAFGDTGFGLRTNYTYSDGTTSEGHALPYNSKNSYTIAPYYERGPISASISYSYRSEYLAGGYVAGAPPASVDAYKELDASVGYAFNDHWSLTLNGLNLLNSTYFQYFGTKDMPANKYKTGRMYLLTAHFKF